jgi:hypothetical protein
MSHKNTANEIKNTIKETLKSSSIHGVPNITKAKFMSLKVMWLICLLGSSGYCSYIIYQSVSDYLKYGVVSFTRIEVVSQLNFPIVIICNLNMFATQHAHNLIEDYLKTKDFSFMNLSEKNLYLYKKYDATLFAISLNDSDKNRFGYQLDQMMLSCVFNLEDCSVEKDFVQYYDPSNGICYKYNDARKIVSKYTGSSYNLQLEFILDPYFGKQNDVKL